MIRVIINKYVQNIISLLHCYSSLYLITENKSVQLILQETTLKETIWNPDSTA